MNDTEARETLAVNAVFDAVNPEACDFSGPHRIVTANWITDQAYLIDLKAHGKQKNFKRPFRKRLSDLRRHIDDIAMVRSSFTIPSRMRMLNPLIERDQGAIKLLKASCEATLHNFVLDEDEAKRQLARLQIVEQLLQPDWTELALECGQLGSLVSNWAAKWGTTRFRVYQLCYRFWVFEQLPAALVTDYHLCGKRQDGEPRGIKKKLGRPNMFMRVEHGDSNLQGVNCQPGDINLMQHGYTLFYRGNLSEAYRETIRRFFNAGTESSPDGSIRYVQRPDLEVPTYYQFRYWVDQKFDIVRRLMDRTPDSKKAKDLRGLHGSTLEDSPYPGHTYQIDSTTADVWLVSAYNRSWLIGRPIIYFVVDSCTGCIVGIHITLGTPNAAAAKLALHNAFSDKREWLAHYGFRTPDDAECWMPKAPLPRYVRADRAELLSFAGQKLADRMLFDIQFPGAYRPDLKPDVERIMWTSKCHYDWIPGAVNKRQLERGERDYRLDSKLTLYEFTQIILAFVRDYNQHAEKPSKLNLDAQASIPPVPPNPLPLWNFGLSFLHGSPRYQSEETLIREFLPTSAASITKRGVEIAGFVYRPDWSTPHFPLAEYARNFHNLRIPVVYHPSLPDTIKCLNRDTGKYETLYAKPEPVNLNPQFEDAADKDVYQDLLARLRSSASRQDKSDSKSFIEGVIERARAARDQQQEAGTSLKSDDIRAARVEEIAFNQGEQDAGTIMPGQSDPVQLPAYSSVVEYLTTKAAEHVNH